VEEGEEESNLKNAFMTTKTIEIHSAGAIVCISGYDEPRMLILVQNNKHYNRKSNEEVLDIGPKGRIQEKEDAAVAAEREAEEEIGVKLRLDINFTAVKNYEFDDHIDGETLHIKKSVIYFLTFLPSEKVDEIKLSGEHLSYEILTFEQATKRVKYESDRSIIKQCEEYLKKQS
jgi:8-oxo-dGTP pyrophosphatase MutT (NUDIX family)